MPTKNRLKVYAHANGSTSIYRYISKGVYQTGNKSFTVLKRVNGNKIKAVFTNKTAAKRYYSSLR